VKHSILVKIPTDVMVEVVQLGLDHMQAIWGDGRVISVDKESYRDEFIVSIEIETGPVDPAPSRAPTPEL
jgi:hypothetical protein